MLGCLGALAAEESSAVRCTQTDMLDAALTLSDPVRVLEDVCMLCAGKLLRQEEAGRVDEMLIQSSACSCMFFFGKFKK